MSFVYAMNDVIFSIMSDTKIGIKDDLPKLWNSESEKRLVTQMGLMKSIIVLPNIVIAYAGNNINKAAELLRNVKNSSDNLEEIISAAFKIHTTSEEDAIEFIIAYCDENTRELISVKNQQVFRNCKVAWLGSWEAYNEFKRLESLISEDDVKGKKSITCTDNGEFLEEDLAEELVRDYKIEECFSEVVNSGIDPTVGGMAVRIRAMEGENTFQYMAGMNAIASNWPQIVKLGENIIFYQGADKGSYCCNVYQSSRNFCCYVYEADCGIVYTDEVSYSDGLKGMKFPKIYKMDKHSFDDIATQNGAYSCIEL